MLHRTFYLKTNPYQILHIIYGFSEKNRPTIFIMWRPGKRNFQKKFWIIFPWFANKGYQIWYIKYKGRLPKFRATALWNGKDTRAGKCFSMKSLESFWCWKSPSFQISKLIKLRQIFDFQCDKMMRAFSNHSSTHFFFSFHQIFAQNFKPPSSI